MSSPVTDPISLGLPHRPPFLFISKVLSLEPGVCGVAEWKLEGTESFFEGHFPGEPLVPGVLLTEALAQLSGIVGGSGTAWRLAAVRSMKFQAAARPPCVVRLESRLAAWVAPVAQFEVAARCGTEVVASGGIVLGRVPSA